MTRLPSSHPADSSSPNDLFVRRADDRFHTRLDWLKSWHTFSFGHHYHPDHTHFRSLRVFNDDIIAPRQGFGRHPHRDMEILTWVLSGELEHRDSLGSGQVLRPGDLQRMSAGRGIEHSEVNPSDSEPVHLLQIWLQPDRLHHDPQYGQRHFPRPVRQRGWVLLASPDGRNGSLDFHQNALLYTTVVPPGASIALPAPSESSPNRAFWVHVAYGSGQLGATSLSSGDAAAFSPDAALQFQAQDETELLLFDLA